MSAAYEGLPIYKAAKDMTMYFELIVRGFERYHKYTIGSELRSLSYAALFLITEANVKAERKTKLRLAREKLLELKMRVDLCKEIGAFRKKNNFPTAIEK
jgi:hypothetical protein